MQTQHHGMLDNKLEGFGDTMIFGGHCIMSPQFVTQPLMTTTTLLTAPVGFGYKMCLSGVLSAMSTLFQHETCDNCICE